MARFRLDELLNKVIASVLHLCRRQEETRLLPIYMTFMSRGVFPFQMTADCTSDLKSDTHRGIHCPAGVATGEAPQQTFRQGLLTRSGANRAGVSRKEQLANRGAPIC
jgi:hypothetical protein